MAALRIVALPQSLPLPAQAQRRGVKQQRARPLRQRCTALKILSAPNGGFEGIVFKGGGVKGMAYVGALQALKDNGVKTSSMNYFAGSSAGSIVAALVAADMSVEDMKDALFEIEWSKVKDGPILKVSKLFGLLFNYGLYKGEYLEEDVIERRLREQTGVSNITFAELRDKTGNYLSVTGTDLSNKELDFFNPDTAGDMSVSKAVHISSCVPLLFRPVKYKGTYYVDGGTLRNLDLDAFEGLINPPKRALAMDLINKPSTGPSKINSVVDFLLALITTLAKYANLYDNQKPDNVDVLRIDTAKFNALDFDITKDQQKELYDIGYKAVEDSLPKATA